VPHLTLILPLFSYGNYNTFNLSKENTEELPPNFASCLAGFHMHRLLAALD
jgi:hypothetical protein